MSKQSRAQDRHRDRDRACKQQARHPEQVSQREQASKPESGAHSPDSFDARREEQLHRNTEPDRAEEVQQWEHRRGEHEIDRGDDGRGPARFALTRGPDERDHDTRAEQHGHPAVLG